MLTTEPIAHTLSLAMLVKHMAWWCVQFGEDLDSILLQAKLSYSAEELLTNSPESITPEEYSRFYAAVARCWHEQAIGKPKWGTLEASSSTLLAMGYCALSASTLGEAMQRIAHFINLFKEHRGSVELRIVDDHAFLSMRSLGSDSLKPDVQGSLLAADVNGLVILHRFTSWLIGTLIPLEEVGLVGEHHDGSHFFSLFELFGCRAKLHQPKIYLKFSSKHLEALIIKDVTALEKLVNNAAYELLTLAFTRPNLSTQILHLLGNDARKTLPSFDEIASKLMLSPTTLRRHLRRENTSFQQIKDEWRCEAASRYLKSTNIPIEEIAELMGFSDANAFRRAFKKWTGLPPSDFREQYRLNEYVNRPINA